MHQAVEGVWSVLRFYSPGTCGLLRACSSHGGGRHEGVSRNMSLGSELGPCPLPPHSIAQRRLYS